jgi:RimJ/RimL family protein N-acetyltransferase
MRGPRFCLLPVTSDHHRSLYQLTISDEISFRWRFRGIVPSYESFLQSLTSDVLTQFVVVPNDQPGTVLGLVVGYHPNLKDGTAYMGMMSDKRRSTGIIEGGFLLLRHMFDVWPLRKIYLEFPEFNLFQFKSGLEAGILREEGRLVGHTYYQGRYWDELTLAIYRSDFDAYYQRLFPS